MVLTRFLSAILTHNSTLRLDQWFSGLTCGQFISRSPARCIEWTGKSLAKIPILAAVKITKATSLSLPTPHHRRGDAFRCGAGRAAPAPAGKLFSAALSNEQNSSVVLASATGHMRAVNVYSISAKSGNFLTSLIAYWFCLFTLLIALLKQKVSGWKIRWMCLLKCGNLPNYYLNIEFNSRRFQYPFDGSWSRLFHPEIRLCVLT